MSYSIGRSCFVPDVRFGARVPGSVARRGRSRRLAAAAFLTASLAAAPALHAESYFWDQDGDASAATGSIDATGVWNTSTPLFRTGSSTGAPAAWPNASPSADTAVFGATAPGAGNTVTLGSGITVNRINFTANNYTFAGNGNSITLDGASPTIDNATSVTSTLNAPLVGTAGLTKSGAGTLRFGENNGGLSGTINVNAGAIHLNQTGTEAVIRGGSVNATWDIASGASVIVNSNSGNSTVKTIAIGALSGGGILRNGGNGGGAGVFSIGALNTDTTFSGQFTNGPTTLRTAIDKVGAGVLTLTGSTSAFSGNGTTTFGVKLSNGTLAVGADSVFGGTGGALSTGPFGAGEVDLRGTSTAVLRAADATPRTIGNNLTLSNSQIFGSSTTGDLTFTGTMNTGTGAKTLTINNSITTFSGVISGASATNVHTKAGPGTIVLAGENTSNKSWVVNAGTLRLAPASGNNNIASAIAVAVGTGATFDVASTPSPFTLASGQSLRGNGSIAGPLVVGSGSTISPGAAAAAAGALPADATGQLTANAVTWAPGGAYQWDVNDAAGTAGSTIAGHDRLVTGALDVTADASTPFVIRVTSLTSSQAAGEAQNFNPDVSQSWAIASTTGITGGLTGGNVTVDTSGFANAFTGTFGVAQSGNDVLVTYTAVPEPATGAVALAAAAGLLARRRSR